MDYSCQTRGIPDQLLGQSGEVGRNAKSNGKWQVLSAMVDFTIDDVLTSARCQVPLNCLWFARFGHEPPRRQWMGRATGIRSHATTHRRADRTTCKQDARNTWYTGSFSFPFTFSSEHHQSNPSIKEAKSRKKHHVTTI